MSDEKAATAAGPSLPGLRLEEVTEWRVSEGLDGTELALTRKYSRDVYLLTPEQVRGLADALQAHEGRS